MASQGMVDDPLRGGGAFDDQDMEDLTSHLANLPAGRGSHDGLDLGDNSELQGNLDRFRALAGDDSNDELFASYGGLGLGLGVSDSIIITTTNYPTYGELAAAKPPSYEDSIMYEQAPLGIHAAATAAAAEDGGGGGAGGGAGGGDDPLTSGLPFGGPAGTSTSTPFPPAVSEHQHQQHHYHQFQQQQQQQQQQQAPPSSATNGGGGAPWGPHGHEAGPLGGLPRGGAGADGPGGSGTGRGQATSSSPAGAGTGRGGAEGGAAGKDPLQLPGSAEFRVDDFQALSPQLSSPGPLPPSPPGPSGASVGAGRGGPHLRPHPHHHHHQLITVSEPIKREQGGLFGIKGGYVTYLVRAKARPGGPSGPARPETTVRRRFREFVALSELLKERYRGYFVPPRPEKNAMEGQRMTDAFVEERRLALERYLNKLSRHPVLGASEELRLFLEVEGELADSGPWLALRPTGQGGSVLEGTAKFSKQILGIDRAVTDPVQAAQPTKKATDFMRAIKETAQRMQSTPSGCPLPADEVALVRAREEVEALQGGLTTASRAAEKLVSRLDRWSLVTGELGLALVAMRNAEKAEGVALANHTGTLKQSGNLMHDTERVGTALVRSSRIGRKVTGRCAIELGCLHEYLGLMPAALKGLRARDKALLTADTLQSDLEGRRRAISDLEAAGAKVLGGDAAKAKKVADLSGDVAVLEQSVVAARARYEAIKAVNQQEVGRLRGELRSDLGDMLAHYAAIMSACSQRNLEIWLQAAGELGATQDQLQSAKARLVGPGPGPGGAAAGVQPLQPLQAPPPPQHQ